MKKYEFNIPQYSIETFFPTERIKTKLHLLEILLEATRYMLAYSKIKESQIAGKAILVVDKMSRLFFKKDKKYYSIVFPFYVNKKEDDFQFTFQNNIDVNSRLISNVISVIKCDSFKNKCSLDFADSMLDFENELDDFWVFIRELLLAEEGYIRYDFDVEGYEEAKKKGEEHKHPLNHYDLFYSNKASFKIGLEKEIAIDEFVDVLNIHTDCKYLKDWR